MSQGTWVGLDVHARKTVAGGLDAVTGAVCTSRAPTLAAETVEWLGGFPAPVRVAYEAGPTGYGLARACTAAGVACTVAAPSKIPRASQTRSEERDDSSHCSPSPTSTAELVTIVTEPAAPGRPRGRRPSSRDGGSARASSGDGTARRRG
jgi:hypothetical protein